ncbi:MAG: hypothetical protein M1827_001487 [Pycnora praestabilis]|nr:MAG: hypothetical protein M1827_001487 [Pycnora praestabilis]
MAAWRGEYLAALEERDKREKANFEIFNAYTRLADRTAIVEATATQPSPPLANPSSSPTLSKGRAGRNAEEQAQSTNAPEALSRIRQDLVEAQRSKAELQGSLKAITEEVQRARNKAVTDSRQIKDLSTERTTLSTRVRDRDEELRGKAKLLESVQDEMVSLNLQLNMAEQRCKKYEQENDDLVDRWMTRMGQEADAMNDASRFS